MKRAKFTYEVTVQGSRRCIIIRDVRKSWDTCLTVTQDMQTVIDRIEEAERIHAEDFLIVYCDTLGVWDGWDARASQFVKLNQKEWPAAVKSYVQLQALHLQTT